MTEKTKQILSYVVYGVILAIIAAAIIILPSLTKGTPEAEQEKEGTKYTFVFPPREGNF